VSYVKTISFQLHKSLTICIGQQFKLSKDAASLLDYNEKIIGKFGFLFFVGEGISRVGFWPFWLGLPGPGPQRPEGIF